MSTNHLDENIKDITRAIELTQQVIENSSTIYTPSLIKEILVSVRLRLKHEQILRGNHD